MNVLVTCYRNVGCGIKWSVSILSIKGRVCYRESLEDKFVRNRSDSEVKDKYVGFICNFFACQFLLEVCKLNWSQAAKQTSYVSYIMLARKP